MNIPESLVWAVGNLSGLKIYCQDNQKEEIQSFFENSFAEEWTNAVHKVEEEYGEVGEDGDEEIENPMHIEYNETGLFVSFDSLCIPYQYGDYSDDEYGNDALKYTLKRAEKNYPDIQYEGYIAYCWSDIHGGSVTQYSVHSKMQAEKEAYDFIGYALKNLDYEELSEQIEDSNDFKAIVCLIAAHAEWLNTEDIYAQVLSIAAKIDDTMYGELCELVERLRAGEKVVAREDNDNNKLPDWYEPVMLAYEEAEEYEKELIHDGFMPELTVKNYKTKPTSDIDLYPHVALKALEGDEKALKIAQMLEDILNYSRHNSGSR